MFTDHSTIHLRLAVLSLIAYLLGALPFGLIIGKIKGTDIREHGSRNIGASNAGRVLGRKFFWIVFALDLLKGLLPMVVASAMVAYVPLGERSQLTHLLWLGVGVAGILGHVFPIYLKFRGGKGVATSLGVVLGLWPYFTLAGMVVALVFVAVLMASRFISLGSICGAITFPLAYLAIGRVRGWDLWGDQLPLVVLAFAIAGLVIWRHRDNVRRLRAGTENRIRTSS